MTELERLQLASQKTIGLLHALPASIVLVNLGGTVKAISLNFEPLTGYDAARDIHNATTHLTEILVTKKDPAELIDFIKSNCVDRACTAKLRRKDGSQMDVVFGTSFLDENTLLLCFLNTNSETVKLD